MTEPVTITVDDNGVTRELKEGVDFTVSEFGVLTLAKPLRPPNPEIDDKGERAVVLYTTNSSSDS